MSNWINYSWMKIKLSFGYLNNQACKIKLSACSGWIDLRLICVVLLYKWTLFLFEILCKSIQNTEQWQHLLWIAWNNNPPIKTIPSNFCAFLWHVSLDIILYRFKKKSKLLVCWQPRTQKLKKIQHNYM